LRIRETGRFPSVQRLRHLRPLFRRRPHQSKVSHRSKVERRAF
jgi:hypothetical protein